MLAANPIDWGSLSRVPSVYWLALKKHGLVPSPRPGTEIDFCTTGKLSNGITEDSDIVLVLSVAR